MKMSRFAQVPHPDEFIDEICQVDEPYDVPGSIRRCLMMGIAEFAYLKALQIYGVNLPPGDAPPAAMCLIPALDMVGVPEVHSYLTRIGLDVVASEGEFVVVSQSEDGSITQEQVKKVKTDLVFFLVMRGRVTKSLYMFVAYYTGRGKKTATFTATPAPNTIIPVLEKAASERCGI